MHSWYGCSVFRELEKLEQVPFRIPKGCYIPPPVLQFRQAQELDSLILKHLRKVVDLRGLEINHNAVWIA